MISVIIPAYNAQAYLRDCLESVLAQTYTDWETIIVDDGSTDSTASIALEYAGRDGRFRVVRKSNGGLADARNFGLGQVRGEWVTFLDSDDMLYPTSLTSLESNVTTDCDVVVGEYVRSLKYSIREHKNKALRCLSGYEAAKEGLLQIGINTSVCGKLYRYESIKDVSFRKGMWYEDLDYFAKLFPRLRSVVIVSDEVYFYRDNPGSFINTFSSRRFDVLTITEDIEKEYAQSYPDLLPAARDRRLSANFNIFGLLCVHDKDGQYAAVKEQCWQLIKSYRLASLRNPQVRLKNKLGILVSYIGKGLVGLCSRIMYK